MCCSQGKLYDFLAKLYMLAAGTVWRWRMRALLSNCVERNNHEPESLWAEKKFPVPPSPLFRNDAAALPPRHFRRCTCNIFLIKTYIKSCKISFSKSLIKICILCTPPPLVARANRTDRDEQPSRGLRSARCGSSTCPPLTRQALTITTWAH